jgi:hypothetical protein
MQEIQQIIQMVSNYQTHIGTRAVKEINTLLFHYSYSALVSHFCWAVCIVEENHQVIAVNLHLKWCLLVHKKTIN